MLAFHLIDPENWERKEYYLHYMNKVVCSYTVTVDLDITALKGEKLYPAMIWLLTKTVNAFPQFRMGLSDEGLGIFDSMNPSYTILNEAHKNFSCIWTLFSDDYGEFLKRYQEDTASYVSSTQFAPKPGMPQNCFDISMIPWMTFTGINLNVAGPGKYLKPIFTMGKYFERDGKILLPLAIQVHHAVCDGYHVSMFVEQLQQFISEWPLNEGV